ncbi:MAG: hypothetical protein HPY44_03050 [Armatimonadetes bacterium]|nr:hypothetical protein [Armatimonadota bacterium]
MRSIVVVALSLLSILALPEMGLCEDYVILANKVAAKITSPGPFNSIFERVSYIDKQVSQAISVEDVGRPKMYVVGGPEPAIYIGKTLLTKVYPSDVAGRGMSQMDLARAWKANFERLFPLAEPCIRMGKGKPVATGPVTNYTPPAKPKVVEIPTRDWAMVAVVLDHLLLTRACSDELFDKELPNLVATLYDDILQGVVNQAQGKVVSVPPHAPGNCPEGGQCPGCRKAKQEAIARPIVDPAGVAIVPVTKLEDIPSTARRRIESGLKLMHSVDDARYKADRVMVARTVFDVTRKAIGESPAQPVAASACPAPAPTAPPADN